MPVPLQQVRYEGMNVLHQGPGAAERVNLAGIALMGRCLMGAGPRDPADINPQNATAGSLLDLNRSPLRSRLSVWARHEMRLAPRRSALKLSG
jgi:hypothetical protein